MPINIKHEPHTYYESKTKQRLNWRNMHEKKDIEVISHPNGEFVLDFKSHIAK